MLSQASSIPASYINMPTHASQSAVSTVASNCHTVKAKLVVSRKNVRYNMTSTATTANTPFRTIQKFIMSEGYQSAKEGKTCGAVGPYGDYNL